MNVMMHERYRTIYKTMQALINGEYGAAPAPFNQRLQKRALQGNQPITCRPADNIAPEMDRLRDELRAKASRDGIRLQEGERETDDVLIYALFPQIGLEFLKRRDDGGVFELSS